MSFLSAASFLCYQHESPLTSFPDTKGKKGDRGGCSSTQLVIDRLRSAPVCCVKGRAAVRNHTPHNPPPPKVAEDIDLSVPFSVASDAQMNE